MTIKLLTITGMALAILSGCDSENNGSNKPATEAQAIAAIKGLWTDRVVSTAQTFPSTDPTDVARNDKYYCGTSPCALDPNAPATEKMTARYQADENDLIPVYFNVNSQSGKSALGDPRFQQAMDNLNEVIGRPVFKNMGVSNIDHDPENNQMFLDYSSISESGGFIFSVGTSVKVYDNQQTCGSVSESPNNMGMPRIIIDKNNHFRSDAGWVWVNLDSSDGTCLADNEIATHELMHALGFSDHFSGFGADNEVFGDRAKAALRTLYNNDTLLDPENLTYYHWPAN